MGRRLKTTVTQAEEFEGREGVGEVVVSFGWEEY